MGGRWRRVFELVAGEEDGEVDDENDDDGEFEDEGAGLMGSVGHELVEFAGGPELGFDEAAIVGDADSGGG